MLIRNSDLKKNRETTTLALQRPTSIPVLEYSFIMIQAPVTLQVIDIEEGNSKWQT